jgi:hypothetical protein
MFPKLRGVPLCRAHVVTDGIGREPKRQRVVWFNFQQ